MEPEPPLSLKDLLAMPSGQVIEEDGTGLRLARLADGRWLTLNAVNGARGTSEVVALRLGTVRAAGHAKWAERAL